MTIKSKSVDLNKINSLTKYPSIETYHVLDKKVGSLTDSYRAFDGPLLATEKVDGTNARIIVMPDDVYLIGSREQLLYARHDLIGNPALGIVDVLKDKAESMRPINNDEITVYYGEVYGGKVTQASKQYTTTRQVFRLFDVVRLTDVETLLAWSPTQISNWRESSGQTFVDETDLQEYADRHDFELTPRITELSSSDLPVDIDGTLAFLQQQLPVSQSRLDGEAGGKPEGLVVRTPNRSRIAKLRFQDYERTIKRRRK